MMLVMELCGAVLSASASEKAASSANHAFLSRSGFFYWSKEFPVKDAADDAEIHKNTAYDIYRWLREVCSTKLLQTPIVLGGRGIVVQIDESLFRHKVKVFNKFIHTY